MRFALSLVLAPMIAAACGIGGCGGGDDASGKPDAPAVRKDAAADAAWMSVDDGTPTRQTCTETLGNALGPLFGRMDGFLVAIVPPGNGRCNADNNHVHLQVRMSGMIYDVAVNVGDENGTEDVHTIVKDGVMPGGPWAEGFHTGIPTDYVALGVHAADMPLQTKQVNAQQLMSELANANHISVYATPYGVDGAHLVHRNGSGRDGMIVTQPLSVPSHLRMFSFTSQAF